MHTHMYAHAYTYTSSSTYTNTYTDTDTHTQTLLTKEEKRAVIRTCPRYSVPRCVALLQIDPLY